MLQLIKAALTYLAYPFEVGQMGRRILILMILMSIKMLNEYRPTIKMRKPCTFGCDKLNSSDIIASVRSGLFAV
jgi:hypothetical protein